MRTIRLTITTLILSVSSLVLGNAALADGDTGNAGYRDHGHHHSHYHAPSYPLPPRAYGHDHYQYRHHGIYKKHRRYKHFGKVYDWRRNPHRSNDHRSDYGSYRDRKGSDDHRVGRDVDHKHLGRNRHGRDHSKRMHTAYSKSERH